MEENIKKAIICAQNILSYSDNTLLKLKQKLRSRGFSERDINEAAEYIKAHGWLDEEKQIESAVNSLANKKLYGKARVIQELVIRGFSREAISEFDFSEYDFTQICIDLYIKRGKSEDKNKDAAYLARYGHTQSDIKKALGVNLEWED